jgi:hypothetical protein
MTDCEVIASLYPGLMDVADRIETGHYYWSISPNMFQELYTRCLAKEKRKDVKRVWKRLADQSASVSQASLIPNNVLA